MYNGINCRDVTARKAHKCALCGGKIKKGELYKYFINGKRRHLKCNFIYEELNFFFMREDAAFKNGCRAFCKEFICRECKYFNSKAECEKNKTYCANKIYKLLQTHRLTFAKIHNKPVFNMYVLIKRKK